MVHHAILCTTKLHLFVTSLWSMYACITTSSCSQKRLHCTAALCFMFARTWNRTADKKGLRVRNSPTCTLSQNGYGGLVGKPCQLLTKSPLPCDVLVRSQPCAINSLYEVANHSSIQIRALETEIVDVFQIQCFFTHRSCGLMDKAPPS